MATATGPGDGERRRAQNRRLAIARYTRDISVNVIANLIAASIGWLILTSAGVIRGNAAVTFSAIFFLGTALIWGLMGVVAWAIYRRRIRLTLLSIAIIVGLGTPLSLPALLPMFQGTLCQTINAALIILLPVIIFVVSVRAYMRVRRDDERRKSYLRDAAHPPGLG
jgi:hypothetical protein